MANTPTLQPDELQNQIKDAAQNLFSLLARHTSSPTASLVDTPSQSLPGPAFSGGRGASPSLHLVHQPPPTHHLVPAGGRGASPSLHLVHQPPPTHHLVPAGGRGHPSVQEEMERSFPYYGKRRKGVPGRRPPPSNKIQPVKYIRLQFILMAEVTDKTPKPKQETQLLEAGLGRRTINMPERAEYEEIVGLLEDTYPKLKLLSGGWLFYKAAEELWQEEIESRELKQEVPVRSREEELKQEVPVRSREEELKQEVPVRSREEELKQEVPVGSREEELKREVPVKRLHLGLAGLLLNQHRS
ncbi:uncharacterized protein [Osmerus mordax]|uniref:uncharacterized protein n=1 Tax=Osmerus mordax TaxID=8014 RepID=UPI00350FF1AD